VTAQPATVPAPGWQAAVFDLDGVLMFTARTHSAAWAELFDEYLRARSARSGEPFRPFTEADYRDYVDGRPRYDGVRTFLASRGITLPEGEPTDPPERETVCGLGNRKNVLFRARMAKQGVPTDDAAVGLVRALRASGVGVGLASSSKNAGPILARAGLVGLFDAVVDGVAGERLGLAGKPAPDIFVECLRQLGGSDPAQAIVVEDADTGVAAGRAGGFGLVLGVDRDGRAIALREHGADWVVRDLGEVTLERLGRYFANRANLRPNALARWPDLAREMQGRRPAIFLDYDGTLTPIVSRPDLAVLTDEMRQALRAVAGAWPTTIVSGRGREDVAGLVGLDQVDYAGSHGFDIAGPQASSLRLEVAPEVVPVLAGAFDELRARTAGIPGALVENKRFSLAVHYRLVAPEQVPELERIVDEALAERPQLRKAHGKMVFELRPAIDWDKGKAVLWLMDALGLAGPEVLPLYVGDDVTDEDAFRALAGRGIGVLVSELPRPTAACYAVQDVNEVGELLRRLASLAGAAS
jgi:trehalose 6-phosphate phosphatase